MLADTRAIRDVLGAQQLGCSQCRSRPLRRFQLVHRHRHGLQRPAQVDRRRACRQQGSAGALEVFHCGVERQRLGQAERRRNTYQRRAAHLHGANGMAVGFETLQLAPVQSMRQQSLVYDLHDLAFGIPAQAAQRFSGGHGERHGGRSVRRQRGVLIRFRTATRTR